MARKTYTQEQKTQIINKAKTIGAAAASKAEGVSYATVLKWLHSAEGDTTTTTTIAKKVKDAPGNTVKGLDKEIAGVESEIDELNAALKSKKTELAGLKKARSAAEKAEAREKDLAEKKKIVDAVLKSGKSVEEVLALLNS